MAPALAGRAGAGLFCELVQVADEAILPSERDDADPLLPPVPHGHDLQSVAFHWRVSQRERDAHESKSQEKRDGGNGRTDEEFHFRSLPSAGTQQRPMVAARLVGLAPSPAPPK